MPDAATAPTPPPVVEPGVDHRFERWPMVRNAMILLIPTAAGSGHHRVSITETSTGGRLTIETASGSERDVALNVLELRALSDFCNRIARRVATRPDYRP